MAETTDASKPQRQGDAPFANILAVCGLAASDSGTLGLARELAAQSGTDVAIRAVLDRSDDLAALARATGTDSTDAARSLTDDAREGLVRIWREVGGEQLSASVTVEVDKPVLAIVRDVRANGRDLVIKTAEPGDGLHRFLLGSTDQHLLRKCPSAVWLRAPNSPWPVRRILAAVDLDTASAAEPATLEALNKRIMDAAARLAGLSGAALHVVHVRPDTADDLIYQWCGDTEAAHSYIDDLERTRESAMNRLIQAARAGLPAAVRDHVRITPHLAQGAPRRVIPAQAAAIDAGLLVLGTIARTGVPGLLIGNTAEDVLNSVDCAVLTMKPPGFVSPLAP
jgi:nucleotide-binding universal stress UspA family protein